MTFRQWRQILAEPPSHPLLQMLVGGGDHAHIALERRWWPPTR